VWQHCTKQARQPCRHSHNINVTNLFPISRFSRRGNATPAFIEKREKEFLEFTNDELKAFIAANSEAQLRVEINQMLNHGLTGCLFPMLQMVQILFEKGGWDRKSWTKELDSGRARVGQSFLDAVIYSYGGFSDDEQLCV
jgi:hypothetical protein